MEASLIANYKRIKLSTTCYSSNLCAYKTIYAPALSLVVPFNLHKTVRVCTTLYFQVLLFGVERESGKIWYIKYV